MKQNDAERAIWEKLSPIMVQQLAAPAAEEAEQERQAQALASALQNAIKEIREQHAAAAAEVLAAEQRAGTQVSTARQRSWP